MSISNVYIRCIHYFWGGRQVEVPPPSVFHYLLRLSMEVQRALGSDIVVFDECTPYPSSESTAALSMELSLRWDAMLEMAIYLLQKGLCGFNANANA